MLPCLRRRRRPPLRQDTDTCVEDLRRVIEQQRQQLEDLRFALEEKDTQIAALRRQTETGQSTTADAEPAPEPGDDPISRDTFAPGYLVTKTHTRHERRPHAGLGLYTAGWKALEETLGIVAGHLDSCEVSLRRVRTFEEAANVWERAGLQGAFHRVA